MPTNPPKLSSATQRLPELLALVLQKNAFYREKYANLEITPNTPLLDLPFTCKQELNQDQIAHPPYGTNLTDPIEAYHRLHQTSGTTSGKPLRCLDTAASWQWLLECWKIGLRDCIQIQANDRIFFPFSFGPFLGFWAAFEAALQLPCLVLPGGGMSSTARLKYLLDHQATILCCTPTYALHLAEIADKEGIKLVDSAIRAVIVAGEPGGSLASTRECIQAAWGARVFDHYGMTEIGPVAFECIASPGEMHLLEDQYLVEILDPNTRLPVSEGELGELVLTNLGRSACPLIRYRTGDMVRFTNQTCECGLPGRKLQQGILGRTDDMIHIRGNNVYPSAIESVVRRFNEVTEFRIIVDQSGPLTDLHLEIEPNPNTINPPGLAQSVSQAIRDELLFRVGVVLAPIGSLPRYEFKARRVVRNTLRK